MAQLREAPSSDGSGALTSLAQRYIVYYYGKCTQCEATFDGPRDATIHATGESHVVRERRHTEIRPE